MANDWTGKEVAATVAVYLAMLENELLGIEFVKRRENRMLQSMLPDRSVAAIERKHGNISAIMVELGLPYLSGYRPLSHYQQLLKEEVVRQVEEKRTLLVATQAAVSAPAAESDLECPLDQVMVDAPVKSGDSGRVAERFTPEQAPSVGRNYLEIEARNSSLGEAGELFALEIERRRLIESGYSRLADRIEHVSRTRGDGLGFDILSYEPDGRERLIEVKTTRFGQYTPFFASSREVEVSWHRPKEYKLYRVFKFGHTPRLFTLAGALSDVCILTPVQYRASVA